jgi:hypothetical protein
VGAKQQVEVSLLGIGMLCARPRRGSAETGQPPRGGGIYRSVRQVDDVHERSLGRLRVLDQHHAAQFVKKIMVSSRAGGFVSRQCYVSLLLFDPHRWARSDPGRHPSVAHQAGIYSRGRFGAWRHEIGNTDHSAMRGVEIAAPRNALGSCCEAKKPTAGCIGAALLTRGASRQGYPEFGLVALVRPPQKSSQEYRPSRPTPPR